MLNQVVLKPFYQCKSVECYNGIELKPRLLRTLFMQVIGSLEEVTQISFHLHPDESEAADHTFKLAKMISASGFHKGRTGVFGVVRFHK